MKTPLTDQAAGPTRSDPDSVIDPLQHAQRIADPRRLKGLAATGLLDALEVPALDRVTRLAQRIFGVPVSLFSVVDDRRQVFASAVGLDGVRETPLSHSFCQYVVSSGQTFAVEDARQHPLVRENGAVRDLAVIAYLGQPVRAPNGEIIGSFCAISDRPHSWSDEDRAALADLALMIESELRLREEASRSGLLARELEHRMRNLFAVSQSLVRFARREARAEEQGDSVERMAERLTQRFGALSDAHAVATRRGAEAEGPGGLMALIERILAPYHAGQAAPIKLEGPDLPIAGHAVTYLALALHELATNALKYGGLSEAGGGLAVLWRETEGGQVLLDWTESGIAADGASSGGFGSTLLENAVAGGLGGELAFEWGEGRLAVRLTLPGSTFAH